MHIDIQIYIVHVYRVYRYRDTLYVYIVRTQETTCSSDSRLRRKLTGRLDIVFCERRDRRCCVWQHGSGSAELHAHLAHGAVTVVRHQIAEGAEGV